MSTALKDALKYRLIIINNNKKRRKMLCGCVARAAKAIKRAISHMLAGWFF